MADKLCPNCGSPIRPGAKFCAVCGNKIEIGGSDFSETHFEETLDAEAYKPKADAFEPLSDSGLTRTTGSGSKDFAGNWEAFNMDGWGVREETKAGTADTGTAGNMSRETLANGWKMDSGPETREELPPEDKGPDKEKGRKKRQKKERTGNWELDNPGGGGGGGNGKSIVPIIGGLAVVAILIVAIILAKDKIFGPKDITVDPTTEVSQGGAAGEDTEEEEVTEEDTEATTEKISVEEEPYEEPYEEVQTVTLEGVSDDNYADYDYVAMPGAYNIVKVNSEFSFGYPRNFFNQVEVSGNNYTFYTNNDTATMYVRQEESYSSDPVSNVTDYYQNMMDKVDSSSQVTGVHLVSESVKNGWAHALVGGDYGSGSGSVYYIVVSNGPSVYSLTFDYHTISPGQYYNTQNYMIDCIYRLCEHSGTTYIPRTYDQFMRDDMGTKK